MSLVPSLLRAIVQVGGETLVLRVGERPYVTRASGTVDLGGVGLTAETLNGILDQVLPGDRRQKLAKGGSTRHVLTDVADLPGETFDVLATHDEHAVRIEIRRHITGPVPVPPAALAPPGRSAPNPQSDAVATSAAPRRRTTDRLAVVRRGDKSASADATASNSEPLVAPAPLLAEQVEPLHALLRTTLAAGATSVHLAPLAQPWIRLDGELQPLESVPMLTLESLASMLVYVASHGEPLVGRTDEWDLQVPDVGRVRCLAVHDQSGAGLFVRHAVRAPQSAEELGLPPEIERLVDGTSGLLLVAGPHASAKGEVMMALLDTINRRRHAYVVTVERERRIVHSRGSSWISQRAVGHGANRLLQGGRDALREDPDVLCLDGLASPELTLLALTAARDRLVVSTVVAADCVAAVEVLVNAAADDGREARRRALAEVLIAVIGQPEASRSDQARSVLLNGPANAPLIAAGRFSAIAVTDLPLRPLSSAE